MLDSQMQNDTQCAMHAYARTHSLTHSLQKTSWHSRLASKLFIKPCLSICRKNSTELLPYSPHFVYETFSKDLNGILNTHIAAKKPTNPNPDTHKHNPAPFSLSLCALGLVGYSWSKTFFPLSLFGFVNRRTKLLKSTDAWTRRCSQANPNPYVWVSVWGCAQSLSLSVQCPSPKSDVPTSQLSIVSTATHFVIFLKPQMFDWMRQKQVSTLSASIPRKQNKKKKPEN